MAWETDSWADDEPLPAGCGAHWVKFCCCSVPPRIQWLTEARQKADPMRRLTNGIDSKLSVQSD